MSNVNVTGDLLRSGKHAAGRAGFRSNQGVGYIVTPRDRPEHLAERGDVNEGAMEVTPAGVQRPRWAPAFVSAVDSSQGQIVVGTYWLSFKFRSSRYDLESNPGPTTVVQSTDMAPTWTQGTAYVEGNFVTAPAGIDATGAGPNKLVFQALAAHTGNNSTNVSTAIIDFNTDFADNSYWTAAAPDEIRIGPTNFIEAADNGDNTEGWPDDYVDRVIIGRTLAADINVATLADSTRTIESQVEGTFYPALEVSIDSFRTHSTWAQSTAYFIGDKVQATDDADTFLKHYKCVVDHTSSASGALVQGVIDTSTGADEGPVPIGGASDREDLWVLIGQTPILLQKGDDEISTADAFSVRREVPPDSWSMAIIGDRAYYTGQRTYNLQVSVVKASATVTIATVNPGGDGENEAPTGMVGRTFQVTNDPAVYVVVDWISRTQFVIDRIYEGRTQTSVTGVVSAGIGKVFFSEAEGGTPLADYVPRSNVMTYRPENGLGNEAIVEAPLGGFVVQRDSIGWFSQPLEDIREIERASFRTLGDRNIAIGHRGEVMIMCDDGIRLYDGPRPGRLITEPVRDWWTPNANTQFYWNKALLEQCVMIYHQHLQWLIVLGPMWDNASNRGIGLVYDMSSSNPAEWNWGRLHLWGDSPIPQGQTLPQLVFPDITAATNKLVAGNTQLVLGGTLDVDTGGDGNTDFRHHGRLWVFNAVDGDFTTHRDEIPNEKSSAILDHGVPWNRVHRPLAGSAGQRISINGVRVICRPLPQSTETYKIRPRVQQDWNGVIEKDRDVRVALSRSGSLANIRVNRAQRAMTELRGVVVGPDTHTSFEEIHQYARSLGKGDRS